MNLLVFIIGYATIQSILLICLLSSVKRKLDKGIYYLIPLLIVTTFIGVQYMFINLGYYQFYPKLFALGFSPMFLIPPLFYLFSSSNFNYQRLSLKTMLHFMPFVFVLIVQFIDLRSPFKKILFSLFVAQLLGYSIESYRIMRKGRKHNAEPSRVLKFLTLCMLIFAICTFILFITKIGLDINSVNITTLVIAFLIGFVTILEVAMVKGLNTSYDFITLQNKKYKISNLQSQNLNTLNEKVIELLSHKKVFLNSGLNANDMANQLGISRHQLTEFLNQELKCSFNVLMNTYRVDHVKDALLNKNKKHLSISGLANESGFKSTATFYRVFKNQTGLTPLEYIKEHSQSSK
ncbi:helix-turn-helix domain-containing protein [uncultured Winogradskyella sp.]|uniref:helix-turn-helix domain-containing protein n=1 Tax=uncultured Winogradskyella sp. TaxID=395353 RepID=UPI00260CFC67|nr:helix-turn-helix domain-containing protein [uncultured Winogradskyella sp.]